MQVKKKPRNAAAKKIHKVPPKEKRTKKEQTEQPLLKRVIFGEERPDLTELEAGSTTILDILAPTTVDTKSKDYIVVDGVYHTYLYITGYGYATTVGSCWLAPLVEAGEGVNMSFLVKRQSKEKILSKIAQTTMVNRSRMRDVGDTRQDYEELDSAINSGLYLKDVMNRQGEDFYYMHTLIEVTAPDPETLEQRATEVEKLCVSVDMIARRCDYKNEQAFLSSLPILALDPDIERKARRNALTSGVAAAFPFASYELSDHNGIFLGLNLYNRSPVFLDPYDDYKYTNGNWWIGGSTGAGKTVTLQCLGGRLRQQGKRVIIIAPKKGHEFRPLCEKLGGLYLRMSPSSKDCPNLMAIRRKSLDSYARLKNIAVRDDSVLADKISQLIIWFALKKKDLSEEDKSRLDSSLVEVYGRYGITFDNSSIVDENGDFRTMPIISDWYDVLSQNPDTRYLSVVLSRYVTGSAAAMASRNNIDLDNKYIVLDLSGMPDDMIADGTFWATSIAYDLIMSCESDLSALLADELWSLVGATANPQAAGFVLEMVKTIRGLGGIAVTSTQGMQDLFGLDGGSYGKGMVPARNGRIYELRKMEQGEFIAPKNNVVDFSEIRAGFTPALPKIPAQLMGEIIAFFRALMTENEENEAFVQIYWDKEEKRFFAYVPKQSVCKDEVEADLRGCPYDDEERYICYADIHSHNSMDAFFSGKDDRDERSVGLYFVFGELDHFYPEIKARIFCGDNFVTIDPATVIEGLEQPFPQEWLDQVSVHRPVPVKVEKKRSFREFLSEVW